MIMNSFSQFLKVVRLLLILVTILEIIFGGKIIDIKIFILNKKINIKKYELFFKLLLIFENANSTTFTWNIEIHKD